MKIERNFIPEIDIAKFAEANGLTMQVNERRNHAPEARFYAHFKNCEVMDGGCLIGNFGNGATEDQAIAEYASAISLKRVAIDAGDPAKRVEINVPRLTYTPEPS